MWLESLDFFHEHVFDLIRLNSLVLKVLQKNSEKKIHQNKISYDHHDNEVDWSDDSIPLRAYNIVHNTLPVVAYHTDEDTDDAVRRVIKVEPGGLAIL